MDTFTGFASPNDEDIEMKITKVKKPSLWWRLFGRKRFKMVIRVEPIFAPMAQDFDEIEFLSKESESVFFKELKP